MDKNGNKYKEVEYMGIDMLVQGCTLTKCTDTIFLSH